MIETPNIKLINCTQEILEAAIRGNSALAEKLGVEVPAHWSEFGIPAFQYSLVHLLKNPGEQVWWTYFPIHKEDQVLIGSCGFKGPPLEGTVEIGYEVAKAYRNKGFATEITRALISFAFEHDDIHEVKAYTLAEENASCRVLGKSGLKRVDEVTDSENGTFWKWGIVRREIHSDPGPALFKGQSGRKPFQFDP